MTAGQRAGLTCPLWTQFVQLFCLLRQRLWEKYMHYELKQFTPIDWQYLYNLFPPKQTKCFTCVLSVTLIRCDWRSCPLGSVSCPRTLTPRQAHPVMRGRLAPWATGSSFFTKHCLHVHNVFCTFFSLYGNSHRKCEVKYCWKEQLSRLTTKCTSNLHFRDCAKKLHPKNASIIE